MTWLLADSSRGRGQRHGGLAIEPDQSFGGTEPDEPAPVASHTIQLVPWQAVGGGKGAHRHSAVGWAVTFQCAIRRVPTSNTTKTYTTRKRAVTDTKKSQARTACA